MKPTLSIDTLDPRDIDEMIPVGLAFTAENTHMRNQPFNSARFSETWVQMMNLKISEIIVCRHDGVIVGALGWCLTDHPFIDQRVASENFWFVLKAHRGGPAGMLLFNEFEERADKCGADQILMVHVSAPGLPDLQAFYEKHGYCLCEQTFSRTIVK